MIDGARGRDVAHLEESSADHRIYMQLRTTRHKSLCCSVLGSGQRLTSCRGADNPGVHPSHL